MKLRSFDTHKGHCQSEEYECMLNTAKYREIKIKNDKMKDILNLENLQDLLESNRIK